MKNYRQAKIAFLIFDLTHFKMFGPAIKLLLHSGIDDFTFFFTRRTEKYNALTHESNFRKFLNFSSEFKAKTRCFDVEPIAGQFDYIFTVENANYDCLNGIDGGATQIILQNGFDYERIQNKPSPFKQKFVLASKDYEDDYRKYSNLPCVYLPIPITYCDWEYSKKFGENLIEDPSKNITIFYPEDGYNDVVDELIAGIFDNGLTVSIKQRRKNQTVSVKDSRAKIFYDEQWFPSESIFLPLSSICSIGCGTSAYVDATVAGLNFIDIPLPGYARKYYKPVINNLSVIDVTTSNKTIVDSALSSISRFTSGGIFPTPHDTNYEQLVELLLA